MKLNYYKNTDSLYIDLASKPSIESREISVGIVLDYDKEGNLVDIDNASTTSVRTFTPSMESTTPPSGLKTARSWLVACQERR